MEAFVGTWVAMGFLLWGAVFSALRWLLLPHRSYDFSSRVVSAFHAVLLVALTTASVSDWRCPICPLSSPPSHFQAVILVIALSNMMYDLVCCIFNPINIRWDTYIHHIVSIIGIAGVLLYDKCGSETMAALWITEVSSPFLHMRAIFKELGAKETTLYMINDIMFALIFSVARIIIGPYIVYLVLISNDPILLKAMALGLTVVSLYWFYEIVKMTHHKFMAKSPDDLLLAKEIP